MSAVLVPAEAWRESLRSRLTKRGMDVPAEIERRLAEASAEITLARDSGAYVAVWVADDPADADDSAMADANGTRPRSRAPCAITPKLISRKVMRSKLVKPR